MIKKISLVLAAVGFAGVVQAAPVASANNLVNMGTPVAVCDSNAGGGPVPVFGGAGAAITGSHVLAQGFRHICSANVMLSFEEDNANANNPRIAATSASTKGSKIMIYTTTDGAPSVYGNCTTVGACATADISTGMTQALARPNS